MFRKSRPSIRFVEAAAAVALFAAGCGASDSASPDSGEAEEIAAETYESPIAEFLGFDVDQDWNSDESQAEWAEQERQIQEAVVACMAAEGFEYTPEDSSQFIVFDEDSEELEWGTREWTEKYGFGNSTQWFSQSEVGPDLVGYDDLDGSGEEYVDPNGDYLETLSGAEQDAFYEALHGVQPEFDETLSDEEQQAVWENYEPTGCYATAYEATADGAEAQFYDEFSDDLNDLYERIDSDPRVQQLRDEAEACIVGKGFEYYDDEELWEYSETQLEGIGHDWESDPFEGTGLDPETMSDKELDLFYSELNQLSDEDREQLAEVQAAEIEMALVYLDCGAGWRASEAIYNEVRIELEEEFLAANADRIAEYEGSAGGS